MSTKIEWTEETWNPVTGCTKVSQGCKHCYAERWAPKVFAGQAIKQLDGSVRPRVFTDIVLEEKRLDAPLHWKRPRRVFVNSMSDLFHEDVPEYYIDKVFQTMGACDDQALGHTFQILTKRPDRMLAYLKTGARASWNGPRMNSSAFPPRNIWLGVSVEDQATADERIPLLLQTPAAVRFLSCEPLLGAIDLGSHLQGHCQEHDFASGFCLERHHEGVNHLHWVISGGESGPKARPSHPDWFRSLRDQCAAVGVPFFFKQWGEFAPTVRTMAEVAASRHKHVVVPLSATQLYPAAIVDRVGKKAAGRALDGRIHDEYPA